MARRGLLALGKLANAYLNYIPRARMKAKPYIDKYGSIGLIIFIAVPIPLTGMWTGALVAFLLGMSKKWATVSLLIGGLAANLITFIPAFLLLH